MSAVYVLAMVCALHGPCQHGYFLLKNPGLVSCEKDILPMVEGHQSTDGHGARLVWHADKCVTSNNPPQGEMLGMF